MRMERREAGRRGARRRVKQEVGDKRKVEYAVDT